MDRFLELASSPLSSRVSPVRIRIREAGDGPPIVILHGGWGYDIYPFDRPIAALAPGHRVVAPDRTGYGGSGTLDVQPTDFHQRAAEETLALFDAFGFDRAIVWGHSDGAVIAFRLGLMAPDRVHGIVAEATHFFRRKPASRAFFEMMRDRPDDLGERVVTTLQRDHGDRWRALIRTNGDAWLRIADEAASAGADLYDGRLRRLRVPAMLIHGANDPRTEPGELAALRSELEGRPDGVRETRVVVLEGGGHSPHSERAVADETARAAVRFVADVVHGARPVAS